MLEWVWHLFDFGHKGSIYKNRTFYSVCISKVFNMTLSFIDKALIFNNIQFSLGNFQNFVNNEGEP